jgi:tripartite-type tricarboxylate transporter receptor subunit TctC
MGNEKIKQATRLRPLADGVMACVLFAATLYVPVACAQPRTYPARAIRIVVPYVPGGAVDAFVRPLTQELHEAWGQPVTPYGFLAPARTPREIVLQWNGEINCLLQMPEVRERFLAMGMVPLGGSPERHAETLKSEITRSADMIKAAGIALE